MGKVRAICISEKRGTQKQSVQRARLVQGWGLEHDAHGGDWHRQVSLLAQDRVDEFNARGAGVDPGAFGENLVVEGIDLRRLPVGSRLQCGDALLELTQLGKECHSHCAIHQKMGDCIMPREGVFARVLRGGEIALGDEMAVLPPAASAPFSAAVITLSDTGARGERTDTSGPLMAKALEDAGYSVVERLLLPDDGPALQRELVRLADSRGVNLILTSGGTGFSPRDVTPEATLAVAERQAPGIAEALRAHSMAFTPRAMLGRGVAVLRGQSLVVNLPGSPKAVAQSLDFLLPQLPHALAILTGREGNCAK